MAAPNSSDVELSPPRPSRFANAGKASIEQIIDSKFEDRYASKKTSKQLTFQATNPRVQYMKELWSNRFQNFRKQCLGSDLKEAPGGEDIERFITSIITKVRPRSAAGVPSLLWMKDGIKNLISPLQFKYRSFKLEPQDTNRIGSLITKLAAEGKLTRELSKEKQWIGVSIVKKLVTALLNDASDNGTLSWDYTLSKSLSLLLVSALQCRVGDITTCWLSDQPLPFLTWGDITLRLEGGGSPEHLVARITIRNEKGYKYDPHKNRKVMTRWLEHSENNVLCVIKFLLILAMRTENVPVMSVEEIVEAAWKRQDKKVCWIHPNRPVLCAFGREFKGRPELDTAADTHQLTRTIAQAGKLAGVMAAITSHDQRRGSGYDTANVTTEAKGVATPTTALSLGHSRQTYSKGLTDSYVGALDHDFWTARVIEQPENPYAPQISDTPYVAPRVSRAFLDDLCERNGVDPKAKKMRRALNANYKQAHFSEWMKSGSDATIESASNSQVQPLTSCSTSTINVRKRTQTDAFGDRDSLGKVPEAQIDLGHTLSDDEDDIPIDPVLLAQSQGVIHSIAGGTGESMTQAMEELVFDTIDQTPPATSVLEHSPLDFIRHFCQINLISNESIAQSPRTVEAKLAAYVGGSRSPPKLFQKRCVNAQFGCLYAHPINENLKMHQISCPITSASAALDKEYKCDKCPRSYDKLSELKQHNGREHRPFLPRTCGGDTPNCDPTKIYDSKKEYAGHCARYHMNYELDTPTRCGVEGCTSKTMFTNVQSLRGHLKGVHHLSGKAAHQYRPSMRKRTQWPSRKCPIAGCGHSTTYKARKDLAGHLRGRSHNLSEEEIEQHAPVAEVNMIRNKPAWPPRPCPIDGCTTLTKLLNYRSQLIKHLKSSSHGFTDEEIEPYLV